MSSNHEGSFTMTAIIAEPGPSPAPLPLAGHLLAPSRVPRIFAVDDDEPFRSLLSDELTERGFDVTVFADGEALLAATDAAATADVIILDWRLPKMAGIELLPKLRQAGVGCPVVILTGRPLTANENRAFTLGAVDFVDKSRGFGILVRRLRLLIRESAPAPQRSEGLKHGDLTLLPHVGRALWKGEDVGLTMSEFKVVHLLAESRGAVVTYRAIYDCMHYQGFLAGTGEDGFRVNVRSSIRRIRAKIRAFDATFDEIQNMASAGYVWGKDLPAVPAS
jgi:two-component system response regulator ChvI